MSKIPTREEALNLLQKHVTNDALVKHALAVEAVMAHFAEKFGEDVEKWRVIGLVHDLDYEKYPDAHCHKPGRCWRQKTGPKIISGPSRATATASAPMWSPGEDGKCFTPLTS